MLASVGHNMVCRDGGREKKSIENDDDNDRQ